MKQIIKIAEEHIGKRLDLALTEILASYSRQFITKLIDDGGVIMGDKVMKPSYKVKFEDTFEITIKEIEPLNVVAEDIPLNIVYEDDDIIVVNKNNDMVVHPSIGHSSGTLVNALLSHCDDLSGINGVKRPGIVHRIDKDTTGLLVVAKNDLAHESLATQLKDKTMHREYIALVKGIIKEDDARIIAPIGRSNNDRLKMAVNTRTGKEAITHVHVIERFNQFTLVSCRLETGRTHQIRVHLSHIGYPIEGDLLYGAKHHQLYDKGQLLHATKLVLVHPSTHKQMEFVADIPDYFQEIINDIRRK